MARGLVPITVGAMLSAGVLFTLGLVQGDGEPASMATRAGRAPPAPAPARTLVTLVPPIVVPLPPVETGAVVTPFETEAAGPSGKRPISHLRARRRTVRGRLLSADLTLNPF
jgi:hypothetical protein